MDEPRPELDLRDAIARAAAAVGGRRRALAAGLAGVAVVAGLRAATPAHAPTVAVWAAAHDLSGGQPLHAADLRRVDLPAAAVPAGALRTRAAAVGRLLAAPVRRGEPLTDVRLLGRSLLAASPDPSLVAVPVRVADGSAAAALVRAGDTVDVIAAADPSAGQHADRSRARTVAAAVRVLAVPARAGGDGDGLVVVATTRTQAAALARAATVTRLSLALVRA